jgi:hypothetical protein
VDRRIAIVVERFQLGPAVEHVAHVLHALPRRVELFLTSSERARHFDRRAERSQTSGAQQAELLPG